MRRGYRRGIEPSPGHDPFVLRRRLLSALESRSDGAAPPMSAGLEVICRLLVSDLGLSGASVTVMVDGGPQGVAAISDPSVRAADAVQFDVGQGPGQEAFDTGQPVLADDLDRVDGRWPGFVAATSVHGISAVHAFPLLVLPVRLGVLTCYSSVPRTLSAVELGLCTTYAEVTTYLIVEAIPRGTWGPDHPGLLAGDLQIRTKVFQAQGMVTVDLGVGLAEALVRMRAAAFAEGRTLDELAAAIVAGRTFDPTDPAPAGDADGRGA